MRGSGRCLLRLMMPVSEAIVIDRRFRCAYAATASVSANRDTEPGRAFRRPAGISESG